MTVETIGCGGRGARPASAARRSSRDRLHLGPVVGDVHRQADAAHPRRAPSAPATRPSASASPESVTEAGPFTAASATRPGRRRGRDGLAGASVRRRACRPCPRAAPAGGRGGRRVRRRPPARGRRPPRRGGLAELWPTTASGHHAPGRARAGEGDLEREVRRRGRPGARHARARPRRRPAPRGATSRRRAAAARRTPRAAAATTGSPATSSRPMPHHCGPMPGKTNATRGRPAGLAARDAGRGAARGTPQRLRGLPRRRGDDRQAVRVVGPAEAAVWQTSRSGGPRRRPSRAGSARERRAAPRGRAPRGAARGRAPSSRRGAGPAGGGRLQDGVGVRAAEAEGVHPGDAARSPAAGQSSASSATRSRRSSKAMAGFGRSKWSVAGMRRALEGRGRP